MTLGTKKKEQSPRRLRTAALIVIGEIVVLVLVLAILPRTSDTEAHLKVTRVKLPYAPNAPNRTNDDRPFLDNLQTLTLTVQSFTLIDGGHATLSRSTDDGRSWQQISAGSPVRLEAADPLATASFTAASIKSVDVGGAPVLTLIAAPPDDNNFTVMVEGSGPKLTLTGRDALTLQCQMCRIMGSGGDVSLPLVADLRLSDRSGPVIVTGRPDRLVLQPTLGPNGVGRESFRIDQPRFCAGNPPEPTSSVLTATVFFREVNRTEDVPARTAISLEPAEPLQVSALGTSKHRANPTGPEQNAIDLTIRGRVRRFGVGPDCLAEGESHQPSYLDYLQHRPLISAIVGAVAVIMAMAATYGTARKLFAEG